MPLDISQAMVNELMAREPQAQVQQVSPERKGVGTLAKAIYGAGAAADAGTTLYGISTGKAHEANPLINWAGDKVAVPIGAAMEGGAMAVLSKVLKNHPNVMKALLMGAGAVHGGLALHNIGQIKHGAAPTPSPASGAPSNLVRTPNGDYIDPAYFPNVSR